MPVPQLDADGRRCLQLAWKCVDVLLVKRKLKVKANSKMVVLWRLSIHNLKTNHGVSVKILPDIRKYVIKDV